MASWAGSFPFIFMFCGMFASLRFNVSQKQLNRGKPDFVLQVERDFDPSLYSWCPGYPLCYQVTI